MFNHLPANPNKYHSTWLIQAFNPPETRAPFAGRVGPFDFGGGFSGLSKEGEELLLQFLSFAYMGAAEYEWGDVNKAFGMAAEFRQQNLLVARAIEVSGSIAEADKYGYFSQGKTKTRTTVYVLGCVNHLTDIEQTIDSLINNTKIKREHGDPWPVQLKRGIGIWGSLFSPKDFWQNTNERRRFLGGIDLDNGWMVFTDPNLFQRMCELFSVAIPDISKCVSYIPPKALHRSDYVDKYVASTLHLDGAQTVTQICNRLYKLNYLEGDMVASEHVGYFEQVTKRVAVLRRKKLITVDRKTKTYSKVSQ